MTERGPIAVALDTQTVEQATVWASDVAPHVRALKVGLELYLRVGHAGVRQIMATAPECELFLDLKLHDIPNTVRGGAAAVSDLNPAFVTVHALGGRDMVRAAVEAVPNARVAAVTVLTSLADSDLSDTGVAGPMQDAVRRLADLAVSAGARALVCSPVEVERVRSEVGPDITLITPGVRPAGADSDDQARVTTPDQARKAGADLLVVGRPITGATDPALAAARIVASVLAVTSSTLKS